MKRIVTMAFALAVASATGAARAGIVSSTYTFESLSTGALVGQDNWVQLFAGSGPPVNMVTSGAGSNTTLVGAGGGTGTAAQYTSRVNDGNYSFVPFGNTAQNMFMEFDFRDANGSVYVGLGGDANNNGSVVGLNEVALFIGVGGTTAYGGKPSPVGAFVAYSQNFINRAAGPGQTGVLGDWYRLRIEADFTANGGNGQGTLYWLNLTRGDTKFTMIGSWDMQILTATNGVVDLRQPSNWNAIYFAEFTNSATQYIDNITVGTLPEPASLGLLGAGAIILSRRQRSGARR